MKLILALMMFAAAINMAKGQTAEDWTLTYVGAFGMGMSLASHPRVFDSKDACTHAGHAWLSFVGKLPNEDVQFPARFPAYFMCWPSPKPN
jgi:hypothetical protein